jgi:4-amino-4-deoxy-L-arabinose transferase-like glycosyltransferase
VASGSVRVLVVLFAAALLVRVALIVADPHPRRVNDAADYERHAISIATGHGYPTTNLAAPGTATAHRPPAYPYLLGGAFAVSGNRVNAGRALGAVLGAITVALLYLLANAVWGRRVALVAAGLAAIFPPLVMLNGSLVSEALFLPLEIGAAASMVAGRRSEHPLRWAVLIGVLCALAALTRAVGLLLVIPGALALWTGRPRFARRSLAAPALVVAVAACTIAPWTIRNAVDFHHFVPVTTETGFVIAGEFNDAQLKAGVGGWVPPFFFDEFRPLFAHPGINEGDINATLTSRGSRFALHHPGYAIKSMGWNVTRLFSLGGRRDPTTVAFDEMGIPRSLRTAVKYSVYVAAVLALLGLAGMAGLLAVRRGPLYLWSIPILMALGPVLFWGTPRYRTPLDPFILLLVALGLVGLVDRLRGRKPAESGSP